MVVMSMFEPLSKKVNAESKEIVTYSWNMLPEDLGDCVVVPLVCSTERETYDDFVRNSERYILPPLPSKAVNKRRYVLDEFRLQVERFYGKTYFAVLNGKEVYRKGDIIITNCDPVEEHGYHLPLASDDLRGRNLCRVIAEDDDVGESILQIPSLSYGYTGKQEQTKRGTIGIEFETLRDMLVNYLSHWVEVADPSAVFVFTAHAHPGHLLAIDEALERLDDDFHGVEFYRVFDFDLLNLVNERLGEKRYFTPGHASRNETMVLMGYDKLFGTEYVDKNRLCGDRIIRPRFRRLGIKNSKEIYADWNGVNGFGENRPELAEEKDGLEWIDVMKREAKKLILNGGF